jgi:hypothetical protein
MTRRRFGFAGCALVTAALLWTAFQLAGTAQSGDNVWHGTATGEVVPVLIPIDLVKDPTGIKTAPGNAGRRDQTRQVLIAELEQTLVKPSRPRLFGFARPGAAALEVRATVASWEESSRRDQTTPAAPVRGYLTSLGLSTGDAFRFQFVNDGADPVTVEADGLVVEPLEPAASEALRREAASLPAGGGVTADATGYCLELHRLPPVAGLMFRVAGASAQRQFAPARRILAESRRLFDAGALVPDSDPHAYFDSIRQWAIWTHEERLNARTFTDALVEHTRRNVEAAGQQWTTPIEQAVRAAAPHRWQDVQKVLQAAGAGGGL